MSKVSINHLFKYFIDYLIHAALFYSNDDDGHDGYQGSEYSYYSDYDESIFYYLMDETKSHVNKIISDHHYSQI